MGAQRWISEATARRWLAMATVCIGMMSGVVLWSLRVDSVVEADRATAVPDPEEWHQRLNTLATKFNSDRLSRDCSDWGTVKCAEAYEQITSALEALGREVAAYDVTGYLQTLGRVESVEWARNQFEHRCAGRSSHPPTTTSSVSVQSGSGRSLNDLPLQEQIEIGRKMIENARNFDNSESLRRNTCLRLVSALKSSVQDVADAMEADQR